MIFSTLFKPKWKSKDPRVRLLAISQELNGSTSEHHTILKSLATDDTNVEVKIAALTKLSNFELWLTASKSGDKILRQHANSIIEKVVTNQNKDIQLSNEQKFLFLDEKPSTALLEKWLKVEENKNLVITLFEKIDKPQLALPLFERSSNVEIQRYIIDLQDNASMLEKLLKRCKNSELTESINTRLSNLKEAKEKPIQIEKGAQLILAKLLKLKDSKEFVAFNKERTLLSEQWKSHLEDFSLLDQKLVNLLTAKFEKIDSSLKVVALSLEEQHNQELMIKRHKEQQSTELSNINAEIELITKSLSLSVFENTDEKAEVVTNRLDNLSQQVDGSVIENKLKLEFQKTIKVLLNKAQHIDEIAELVTKATHLISRISQLNTPSQLDELNDKYPQFEAWKKEWKQETGQLSEYIPDSITNAFKDICNQWNDACEPLLKEQKQKLFKTRNKLKDVSHLITSGKFNVAFGVFKKARTLFEQLSENQKSQLQREYEKVEKQIADLSDWENYIATPKKVELVELVTKLVNSPLKDPNEQAKLVKQYRKQWNSLGFADEDKEQSLNDAFNKASEEAFVPCRQYYAEQEQQRAKNLKVREEIVVELTKLVESLNTDPSNIKLIEKTFNDLHKQWLSAGQVNRDIYEVVKSRYNEQYRLVKSFLNNYYEENAREKNKIIAQAKALLESGDIVSAANKVKDLQKDWKNVAYAGSKKENNLWNEFRKINDEIFQLRSQQFEQDKKANKELEKELLTELEPLLQSSLNIESVHTAKQLLAQLNTIKGSANEAAIKGVRHNIQTLESRLNKAINSLEMQTKKQHSKLLLSTIEDMFEHKHSFSQVENTGSLSSAWTKKLSKISFSNDESTERLNNTLVIEILAGVDSPKEDQEARMKVQVELMQHQLTSGETLNIEQAFDDWLDVGVVTDNCISYFQRIKPLISF